MPNDDLSYHGRHLEAWMRGVHSGRLKLPKFQRNYVWNTTKIKDMLEALLRGHPIGTLLLIEDNPDRFASRPIKGVDQAGASNSSGELVLDGQQRLTALWRAFTKSEQLFVKVCDWDNDPLQLENILTQTDAGVRGHKNAPSPVSLYKKGCFPFDILGVDGVTQSNNAAWKWCNMARENTGDEAWNLWCRINRDFGEPLRNRDLWHLTLPSSMSREDAINIYVKTNQSSAIIKKFDLAVALYDSESDDPNESLRDEIVGMVGRLTGGRELIRRFFGTGDDDTDDESLIPELGELLLKVVCLWTNRVPTEGNYTKKEVLATLRSRTQQFRDALIWSLEFYTQEGIPGRQFVPSYVPLRVLPALHPVIESVPRRFNAKAKRIVRAYLWRAFLTERYSRSANTRLYEDYQRIKAGLKERKLLASANLAPIFNENLYPLLPSVEDLSDLEQPMPNPKLNNTRSRALFAISLREAKDFGTGEPLFNIAGKDCDRHHLFPKDYLMSNGVTDRKCIDHCLNFALITDKTNGMIGTQPPHEYLATGSELTHDKDGDELKRLVETHKIPFKALALKPKANRTIKEHYRSFIDARGRDIRKAIEKLARGETL